MPKTSDSTPKKSAATTGKELRTVRRPIKIKKNPRRRPKPPRMKILGPHHLTKAQWAERSAEELSAAKSNQKSLTRDAEFSIESAQGGGKSYTVRCDAEGSWSCECPDYVYRYATFQCQYGFYCKHIAVCMDRFLK